MIQDYNSLSIGQRDAISTIINDTMLSDVDKDIRILKILGFDAENAPLSKTNEALELAKFLLSPCPEQKLRTFKYAGYTFKVPSVTDITYAQYVDLCSSSDNAGLLKAICVPQGRKYGDVDIDFHYLPYPIAASVINPFVKSWLKSNNHTLRFLVSAMKLKSIFSSSYRRKVSSILNSCSSTLRKLSSTHWV